MSDSSIYVHIASILGIALVCLLIVGVVEGIRILKNVRRISDRMETLSDIQGWGQFFKRFSPRRSTK